MWFAYLDASALAKRYAQELGSTAVNHLVARIPADRRIVLTVGMAEVASILVRKRNSGRLSPASHRQAVLDFTAEVVGSAAVLKIAVEEALAADAIALIETHSLNSTDAILLRSALNLSAQLRTNGDDLLLATSDRRLLRAARAEGVTTFDPEAQPTTALDALLGP